MAEWMSASLREFLRAAVLEKIERERRRGVHPDAQLVGGLRGFLSQLDLASVGGLSHQESSSGAPAVSAAESLSGGHEPLAMSRKEAAEALGVSVPTLDRLVASGAVRATNVRRRVLIPRDALENYLRGEVG